MGYRIPEVTVVLDVYNEFEGRYQLHFSYKPVDVNEPLVQALLAKWREVNSQPSDEGPTIG